jgi:isopenicillin N synthase-like dioxygenase
VAGDRLPLIDIEPLMSRPAVHGEGDVMVAPGVADVAGAIDAACRRYGFFRVTGHGVAPDALAHLGRLARAFFALPVADKERIAMRHGGAAWRGWFPLGGELTSGRPDQKEGLYFGAELPDDHPAVLAGRPLHGPNLLPAEPAGLGAAVSTWMVAMTDLGQRLLGAMALGLGLEARWFERTVTADPTVLFRIFRYPPVPASSSTGAWGVAEHTDYGLLTLLAQDGRSGLEVRGPDGWIAVPSDPEVLVVNLGDMLERMTGGRYRSTPHRVRNTGADDRLSFPCFVDPSWDAVCPEMPLDDPPSSGAAPPRWDDADPRAWAGTYGDYLTAKVAKVFPDLRRAIGAGTGSTPT